MGKPTIDDVIHALKAVVPRMDSARNYNDMRSICDAIPHDALGTAVLLLSAYSVRKHLIMVESVAWHTIASRLGSGPGCTREEDGIPWLKTSDGETLSVITGIADQWALGQHQDRDTFICGGNPTESFWQASVENVFQRRRKFANSWLTRS